MLEVYKMKKDLLKEGSVEEMMTIILRKKGVTEPLEFGYNTYGKPYLDAFPEFHFNGSHSGEYIVCALCSGAIGIDIQEIVMEKDVMALANRFMSTCESRELALLDAEYRHAAFYRLWAQNEAYMKYTGLGMALPMSSFTVKVDRGHYNIIQQDAVVENITLLPVRIEKGYEGWLCGEFEEQSVSVITLTAEDLQP